MTLKIDKAGRVILPKPVRDRLGKPAERRPPLIKKGRFWVHTAEIPQGYDILKAIDEDREDRMRKVYQRP